MKEQEAVDDLKVSVAESVTQYLPDPVPLFMEIADHVSRQTPNLLPLGEIMSCLRAYMTLRDKFILIQNLANERNEALRKIALLMKEMESPHFLVDKK